MGEGQGDQEQGPAAARRPRHRKGDGAALVAVLARGGTQQEAADAAGISVREVRRRERDPAIARQIRDVRREHQRQMMAKLGDAGMLAIDTLVELAGPEQKHDVRFKAAKELLHAGTRNLESLATREELDELQARVDMALDAEPLEPLL